MYSIHKFLAFYSRFKVTYVKWRHLRVTSGHLKSRDVISSHVTASSCELQPCRKWNVQYTPVFGLLPPLPGDFRSNDVTSGSLPATSGHVTSFPFTWLPPQFSYSLVGSEMHSICQFLAFYSHFQVTSAHMTSFWVTSRNLGSRDVISCHMTASSCELQPCRKGNVQYTRVFAFYSHFQVTSGQMTSLPGHLWPPEVTRRHFRSRDCLLLRATAL